MTHSFSIAPMLDVTDRHCRALFRMLSQRARLYTEMVVANSILYGDRDRFLGFGEQEHPVALQLGGNDPVKLAECAALAEQRGYDEVNLNIGCPSDRVKNGVFGACLMAQPDRVADCVSAMISAVTIPVSVKTRLGIDDRDSYEELCEFVHAVADGGCQHFIVHARKAWLKGLSPKQNREVPPLHYDRVYRLKADFPDLIIEINGGIESLEQCQNHLKHCDGVMLGRAVYDDPWMLTQVDSDLFDMTQSITWTRVSLVSEYMNYIEQQLSKGVYLRHMTRHMLQLFHGQPGAKAWRRYLSEHGPRKGAGLEVVERALLLVDETPSKNDSGHTNLLTSAGAIALDQGAEKKVA